VDSELGDGELTIYFGATSELLFASSVQSLTDLVVGLPWQPQGLSPAVMQIPEDGDYVLQISGNITAAYEVEIRAFNDGNSDFGITETSGEEAYRYDPIYPDDRPVDLGPIAGGNTDLVVNEDDPALFSYNPVLVGPLAEARMEWPIRVEGTLLTPGQVSNVSVESELTNILDVDIYQFELVEGQNVTVDIDTLFGNDDAPLSVGIYNADLELLASTVIHEDDTLPASQQADPFFEVQAIYQIPNHSGIGDPIIDPMSYDDSLDAMVGTYYVVVTADIPFD
ncbi:MAG: hypothetical protein GY869_17140, partial [Planctomycetes bacterium]|nr:hypothetical protein [Planctomycetota bacterium]